MNSDNERFRRIQISRRIAQLNELYNLQHTNLEMENVILELEEDLLNLLRSKPQHEGHLLDNYKYMVADHLLKY